MRVIGIICLILSGLIFVVALFRNTNSKISMRKLLQDYFSKVLNSRGAAFVFVIAPVLFAIGICVFYMAEKELYDDIVVVLSIFISMAFAMMSVLSSRDYTDREDVRRNERIKVALNETYLTIVFDVFLSIIEIVLCLIAIATWDVCGVYMQRVLWGLCVFFFICILENILLIMKKMTVFVGL